MYVSVARLLTRFVFFVFVFVGLSAASPAALAGVNDGLAHSDATLDQATPRRSMSGFLNAAHAGNFNEAARYLDLRDITLAEQSLRGPELARDLAYVLDRNAKIDLTAIEDDPNATPDGNNVIVTTVALDEERVSIALVRVPTTTTPPTWFLSRNTVDLIPALYTEYGPKGWEGHMPAWLLNTTIFGNAAWQWLGLVALIFISYLVGRFTSFAVVFVWKFFAKRASTHIDEDLIGAVRTPFRILFGIGVFRIALDSLALTLVLQTILDHATFSLFVIGMSLLLLRMLNVAMGWAIGHLPAEAQYEFRRRELRTRFGLLLRVADVIVIILATAAILTQFSFVRTVGLSVLASAGIAGVVIGLAAQKSVSSVIAGIQISLTQPIRIGDVVKVEGQTGTVEEVSLTNVVLRLADQRRLIVPVSRFLDSPFENWTRKTTEILGTLTLVVDFATPVDQLRTEAKKIVEANALWDKRKFALTVTDVSQSGVQLSILVSASDAGKMADLRDQVRESLLKFLQQKEGGAYFIATRTAAPAASVSDKEPDATVTK
jgi:small-conductance mechanosensitive channel